MDFRKLKELVGQIPEDELDREVAITFMSETKAGRKEVRRGDVSGMIYIDNLPLELIASECNNKY